MNGKQNAERYLVVLLNDYPVNVWAENFADALKELEETGIDENDVIQITRLDFEEAVEDEGDA